MKRLVLLLALALPVPLAAQAPAGATSAVATSRGVWRMMIGYVAQAAQDMPEADYAYKPVATVRSFGELIAHIAGGQYLMCAAALGETPRAEDAFEHITGKAALVEVLTQSTAYCERAYAQADAEMGAATTLFGQQQTRMFAVTLNTTHVGEHYGNIVTYMRMKGMVPPSSRPRS
jgi:uncharacterized damage-inducible protein DinB